MGKAAIDKGNYPALSLLVILAAGCNQNDHSRETWVRRPQAMLFFDAVGQREQGRVSYTLVSPSAMRGAEDSLRRTPWRAISQRELTELAPGTPVAPPQGTELYLVRAVKYPGSAGVFDVFRNPDGDVWIRYSTMGHRELPLHRHPVIVSLESPPRRLYVSAHMIQ